MDWRKRKYYTVSFDWRAVEMRLSYLRLIDSLKVYPYKDIPKQKDEDETRGHYQHLLSVNIEDAEILEYELNKAKRNDDWCEWKEIEKA